MGLESLFVPGKVLFTNVVPQRKETVEVLGLCLQVGPVVLEFAEVTAHCSGKLKLHGLDLAAELIALGAARVDKPSLFGKQVPGCQRLLNEVRVQVREACGVSL